MYEYGNARIAALRARLLAPSTMLRLEDAGSAGGFLSLLERAEDWRTIVREVGPIVADAAAATELAIEHHRSARLRALPGWYAGRGRALVEALVMPLDRERLIAVLRRRRGGEDPERISATVVAGAIVGVHDLSRIARAPSVAAAVELATDRGLLSPADAGRVVAGLDRAGWAAAEATLVAGVDAARWRRAAGRGSDRAAVRRLLGEELAIRDAVAEELRAGGPVTAALMDRERTLARLDDLAHRARHDPLGVGVVAGYVAAVEAQAIRLRAALARAAGGWSPRLMATYHGARVG